MPCIRRSPKSNIKLARRDVADWHKLHITSNERRTTLVSKAGRGKFWDACSGHDASGAGVMTLLQHNIERGDRPIEAESLDRNMVWIAGGTFRMGSDHHYAEEAPAHRVSVDGFWLDRTPVTTSQFKQFRKATGHKTSAEIAPCPEDYPGALPDMLYAGSLVFVRPPSTVD